MNEILKSKLEVLAGDELILRAIEEVFTDCLLKLKPEVKEEDNALLGEKFRAYEASRELIELGMQEIKSYNLITNKPVNFNKGR